MLTMAEKAFLVLAIALSAVLAGIVVLPAVSYEVGLVTSPDSKTFSLPAGQPFNITCKGSGANGKKFGSLKWLNKEGQAIPKGIPGTQEIEKNSLTLTFTDPKENESGVYKCMAVYEKGQTLQKAVSIIFHGNKPVFDASYQNVTARENSSLDIPCTAEGELPITYEWYNQNEEKITSSFNSSVYVNDMGNGSFLTIPNLTLNHTGTYTCLAKNTHGLSSKIFELIVLSGNDTSGNDTRNGTASFQGALVVNITARSVKFAFGVTGPVENIEVLYRESRNAAEYFKELKYGGDHEIKNLIPAGVYFFKFRTYPSEDEKWSSPYRVVLLPDTPEVIIRKIDSGTVKLEWFFKFEDRMRKSIDRHEISYFSVQMENGTSWKERGCPITIQIPECSSSLYTITGLGSNTYYEIRLRAHTSSGYGEPYSQKIFFDGR